MGEVPSGSNPIKLSSANPSVQKGQVHTVAQQVSTSQSFLEATLLIPEVKKGVEIASGRHRLPDPSNGIWSLLTMLKSLAGAAFDFVFCKKVSQSKGCVSYPGRESVMKNSEEGG